MAGLPMNDRERFLNCMAGKPVDHFPRRPQGFWPATIKRWRGEGLPEGVSPHDYFGFEPWGYLPVDLTLRPGFEREVIDDDGAFVTYRSEKGIVQKERKEDPDLSMPEWIDFPIKSRADFEALKPRYDPGDPGRLPADWPARVEGWANREEVLGLDLYNGLYMTLREWLGPEDLLYAFIDEPEWIDEMLGFYTDFLMAALEGPLSDVRVDSVSFSEDIAYKAGPFISPEMFRRFFGPCYARLAAFFKGKGVDYFVVDSDGFAEPLIPALLEAGVCGVHPCERAAGMDVLALRERHGPRLRLWCGIDKRALTQGREAIDAELGRVAPLIADGGYIPQIDHSVPPNVAFEDFCYYWEKLKGLG